MTETAGLDRQKWTNRSASDTAKINIWWNSYPATFAEGVQRIWDEYIVPRREHLYVTHAATNATYDASSVFTEVSGGTVVCHNAGIPESQPAGLSVRISRRISDSNGATNSYVKVDNPNDIFLDVSDWVISDGEAEPNTFKLFPGTVIPPHGALYLVADRKAFVAAHPLSQVLIEGNFPKKIIESETPLTITDTDGFSAGYRSTNATDPAGEAITAAADTPPAGSAFIFL